MDKETYTKVCTECGEKFKALSKRVRICDNCRKRKVYDNSKRQLAHYKKPKQKNKSKNIARGMSLLKITRLLETYNRKHHKHYTYGQFVNLLSLNQINIEE